MRVTKGLTIQTFTTFLSLNHTNVTWGIKWTNEIRYDYETPKNMNSNNVTFTVIMTLATILQGSYILEEALVLPNKKNVTNKMLLKIDLMK